MKDNKITISNMSRIIWKNIILIVIFTIALGLVGALYAKHKKNTSYESVRNVMIDHSYRGSASNEEVQADISLGKTYSEIIESKDVAKAARRELPKSLKKKYNVGQISSMINATPVDQTTIIKVGAKASTAKDSSTVVNAVTNAAATIIPEKVPYASRASLFAKTTPDEARSKTTPSTKKYTSLGAAVGFLLGLVIAFSITTWKKLI